MRTAYTPLAPFAISLVGRSLPIALLVVNRFGSPEHQLPFAAAYLVAVAGLEYYAVVRPMLRLAAQANALLKQVVQEIERKASIDGHKPKIRIHVLLCGRTLTGRKLIPVFQYGLDQSPYANLSFSIHRGFCGEVFRAPRPRAEYVDLQALDDHQIASRFKWPPKLLGMTRDIRGILVAQLVLEKPRLNGLARRKPFGVVAAYAEDNCTADYLQTQAGSEALQLAVDLAAKLYAA